MYRLNKVIELVVDTDKYRAVTVLLEVAAGAGKAFLCCKVLRSALSKVNNVLFAYVNVLTAVYFNGRGDCFFDSVTFFFAVVPKNEMLVRFCFNKLFHLLNTLLNTVFLNFSRVFKRYGSRKL